jgi:hypothetical protein
MAKRPRTAEGGCIRPRGTYMYAPNERCVRGGMRRKEGRNQTPCDWNRTHTYAPIIRGIHKGTYGSWKKVYITYLPHLKMPSLLLMEPCLAPAKCFAWNLRG